jgi:hypothetical protein
MGSLRRHQFCRWMAQARSRSPVLNSTIDSHADAAGLCVAPVFDYSGPLGRVKTSLRRYAVLTRPARFQQAAITGATGSMSRSLGRTVFLAVARFVAGSRDLLWGQPDDSAVAPHSDWIAVSFMALKRITDGRAERALNSIQIASSLDGSRARIRNGHACNSFRDSHASASATIVAAPKARDATRRGLTTSALS